MDSLLGVAFLYIKLDVSALALASWGGTNSNVVCWPRDLVPILQWMFVYVGPWCDIKAQAAARYGKT